MTIYPFSEMFGGQSFEHEVAEWADGVKALGYGEDWDGSERPGLPAAIAENLPSNEAPATHAWDMPVEWADAMCSVDHRPLAYWLFGPSNYRVHQRAAAGSN